MKCHSERKTLPNQTVIKEKLHFIRIRSTHLQLTSTTQIKRLRIHAHTHKLLGNSNIMKKLFNRMIAILFFHQVIFEYKVIV